MHGTLKLFAPFAAALVMAACNAGGSSVPPTIDKLTAEAPPVPQWQAKNLAHRACPEAGAGEVQCDLLILNKSPQGKVYGWGAPDIEAAYNLPRRAKARGRSLRSSMPTTTPTSLTDLAVYRRHLRFAESEVLQVQSGRATGPLSRKATRAWGAEIELDVDMVSASCPNCTIYLIEANDYNGRSDRNSRTGSRETGRAHR